jgi:riboflavin biosynthesis pyrimidine reductase
MNATFRSLLDPTGGERSDGEFSAREIAENLRFGSHPLPAPTERPYVLCNMVSTVDGRAQIHGRSGPIGGAADHELFHELRTVADAVMVGAGTLRTERYDRIVNDPERRQRRRENGLAEEPFACVVSASLDLDERLPLLEDPSARVVIITPSPASLPAVAANVQYIRTRREQTLDLAGALSDLRDRLGVGTLLCEGGPHLNRELLAAGLLDELWLCFAPKLAGVDMSEPPLAITAGGELDPIVELDLIAAFQSQSYLFLRYGVRSREERVSRETTLSSSLAR